jgi:hypothetical protein
MRCWTNLGEPRGVSGWLLFASPSFSDTQRQQLCCIFSQSCTKGQAMCPPEVTTCSNAHGYASDWSQWSEKSESSGSRSWPLRGMEVGLLTTRIRRLSCSSRCMVGRQLELCGRLSRTTSQDRGSASCGSGKSHPVGGARQSVTCGAAPVGVSIFAAAVLVGAGTPARRPGQAQRTRQPVPAHDGAHVTMAIDAWRWRLGSTRCRWNSARCWKGRT